MKYLDEFRDNKLAEYLLDEISKTVTRDWRIMEICGGQTHAIVQYGIDKLLPEEIQLIHGPGCPVCVTPLGIVDQAIEIAQQSQVIFMSFGDMLRVPGSRFDLLNARSLGADVRFVYSPLEALNIARDNPEKQVVFFAIGFETTAPANAMAIKQASIENLNNFTVLTSQRLVPPAIDAILSLPDCQINGFLAAGHVCSIMGYWQYESLAQKFHIPFVPTGFEPVDLLQGILMLIKQLEAGKYGVKNQYKRWVTRNGNMAAQQIMQEVFTVVDAEWRGIGIIASSGLGVREAFQQFDASFTFKPKAAKPVESNLCISGDVLRGMAKPTQCPAFGCECTPAHPLGATMVSSEGACAAYYKYHRLVSEPAKAI